ncbi:MAG: PEF-CTERM sorting domain-containing protein, partial [Methanosarcinaceae archaeon]
AYLFTASVWGGSAIADGAVTLNGNGVNWNGSINSGHGYNYWADVTPIVKPVIEAAASGITSMTIGESDSYNIEGHVLAVIFDDPSETDNTIVLLFGAQNINGDTFNIGLADPIDTTDPNLVLDMSLGISFGHQGYTQYSLVDVNGVRLTTAAGGEDDGQALDGALMTVGGLGDSNANPANPNATPNGDPYFDDELYNLIPFVSDGDTNIGVYTKNPSNDDNIFFSAFFMGSTTAVVGEGILLSPTSAVNPVGTSHTVTATVQDDTGAPVVGRLVTIQIMSGPNAGMGGNYTTDASGQATFTYTGTTAGTDVIEASCLDSQGNPMTSNQATKTWTADNEIPEFPTVALPIAAILGLAFFFQRRRNE